MSDHCRLLPLMELYIIMYSKRTIPSLNGKLSVINKAKPTLSINNSIILPQSYVNGIQAIAEAKLKVKNSSKGNKTSPSELQRTIMGHMGELAAYMMFFPGSSLVPSHLLEVFEGKNIGDKGDFTYRNINIDVKTRKRIGVNTLDLILNPDEKDKEGIDFYALLIYNGSNEFIYKGGFYREQISEKHHVVNVNGHKYIIKQEDLVNV